MAKKETAEQKLLRIIEDSPKEESAAGGASDADVVVTTANAAEIAAAVRGPGLAMPSVFSSLFGNAQNFLGLFSGKSFGLKQVNMVLIVLIIVAVTALGFLYRGETSLLKGELNFATGVKTSKAVMSADPLPQYEPLASFLEVVLERNIFRPYEKKEVAVVSAPTGREKVAVKMQDLKLVGISWLDTPDSASAMVELKTGMTVFLREGEKAEDVLVKKIFADRVIFAYQDQEMEVRL